MAVEGYQSGLLYFWRKNFTVLKFILFCVLTLGLFSCKQSVSKKSAIANKQTEDHTFRPLTETQKKYYTERLDKMYDSLLVHRGFNGSIIVAKNREVLLEHYRGYADFATKDTITPTTAFHLASISKTFTGMAVLKLVEEHKLNLFDSVQHFFPAFPYHNITVSYCCLIGVVCQTIPTS